MSSGINSGADSVAMNVERLSALLDGELEAAELDALLGELENDPALGMRWSRMCAVHAASAQVAFGRPSLDFASAVMSAIETETSVSVVTAPVATPTATVIDFPRRNPVPAAPARRTRAWRPAYGWAAAATIAAVAVVAPRVHGPTNAPAMTVATNAPQAGFAASLNSESAPAKYASANPVVRQVAFAPAPRAERNNEQPFFYFTTSPSGQLVPVAVKETSLSQVDPETARNLDEFVIEHSNYRGGAGLGGSLGYARFAAHTAELRTAAGSH